jgi:hypothetical protein
MNRRGSSKEADITYSKISYRSNEFLIEVSGVRGDWQVTDRPLIEQSHAGVSYMHRLHTWQILLHIIQP